MPGSFTSSVPTFTPAYPAREMTNVPMPGESTLAFFLLILGLTATTVCGYLSGNGMFHYDDLTHYLFAKWSWQYPAYLLDDWGRPGFTALYFLPAKFSWLACRWWSAILSAIAAWLAFRSAQMIGVRHAWGVIPLIYVQPLFFQLAQTTLTETALAFYLMLAIYLALRGRWTWSAAILSLCFVTRQESIVFLPIWVVFALSRDVKLMRLWPLLWAPIITNIGAWAVDLSIPIQRLFIAKPNTQYGYGGWLGFFGRSLIAWGIGVDVLAMIGLRGTMRRRGGGLIVSCIVAYFGTHTLIRVFGLFASGGYDRFLVPLSPLIGICALAGFLRLTDQSSTVRRPALLVAAASMIFLWLSMERELVLTAAKVSEGLAFPQLFYAKWAIRIATGVIVLSSLYAYIRALPARRPDWTLMLVPTGLLILICLTCYAICGPLRPPADVSSIVQMIHDLRANGFSDRLILTGHVGIDWASGRSPQPQHPPLIDDIEMAPIGTLVAWEQQFTGSQDFNLSLDDLKMSPSFRLVYRANPPANGQESQIWVFEKISPWKMEPVRK